MNTETGPGSEIMDFKNKVEDGICPYKLLKQWVLVYILLVK
jgi:hypothetical protein